MTNVNSFQKNCENGAYYLISCWTKQCWKKGSCLVCRKVGDV